MREFTGFVWTEGDSCKKNCRYTCGFKNILFHGDGGLGAH